MACFPFQNRNRSVNKWRVYSPGGTSPSREVRLAAAGASARHVIYADSSADSAGPELAPLPGDRGHEPAGLFGYGGGGARRDRGMTAARDRAGCAPVRP